MNVSFLVQILVILLLIATGVGLLSRRLGIPCHLSSLTVGRESSSQQGDAETNPLRINCAIAFANY